ncbi:LAO/AO transport system kinase [Hydrobacter penzbergensis]|uniref:LAO/AO transport system kinase n=1 Tax=Hydrobacter penzbergensis TaxID=1235997 RepID=A0A8X8IDN4_9BACT|nr:methylmalonyl Co-A mutase-associated GTPase MeaB [Hydrobacter penzbergensis]SDW58885.1 LAO/AO transport system kinase [Hydrobacter penzbergensis]
MWEQFITGVSQGDFKALARSISLVENAVSGYETFLSRLPSGKTAITGITGPPGAGKSTLVDALIGAWVAQGKKVGVLCVDPSSPFNLGALLGDRIRMSEWYQHPHVFIRSLASRGALGGLHPQMIEITALMQAAGFDEIIVETVGVGQSEIEVAGLADTTVVVVVPEAGDEVQTMKAGLMEIADVFVVNKSDRPDADLFVKNLKQMLAPAFQQRTWQVPVIKTIASRKEGIDALMEAIVAHQHTARLLERKSWLFTERAYRLIQKHRMASIDKEEMRRSVRRALEEPGFNLFTFVQQYL